jgi:hypothetical protein
VEGLGLARLENLKPINQALASRLIVDKSVAQCLNEAIAAAPADAHFRSPSTSSAFYHDSSNLVQPSPASLMDYDSLPDYSLPALSPFPDFFEEIWERSSLHLSPDATETADSFFRELEELETWV